VAATLALLRSAAPGLDQAALRDALLATAQPQGLLGFLRAGQLDPVAALRRVAPQSAPPPLPLLGLRVKQRARRRTLVTWSLTGDSIDVGSFRVSGAGGRTLALRPGASRGAWVRQRHGRVRLTVRDDNGLALVAKTIRLT